jgi:glycosyltransferase involved in cell wall biosynthesis
MCKNRLLIIGSVPHENIPTTYGGTTILMKSFLEYLDEQSVNYKFIQSNRFVGIGGGLFSYIHVLARVLSSIFTSKIVMINAAANGTFYLAPVIYFIARATNRKFVFRKFGGSFDKIYGNSPNILKALVRKSIFKSDLFLVETKKLVSYVSKFSSNVFWFPNVRQKPHFQSECNRYGKKFVFMSHVRASKGVGEIVECSNLLPDDYVIDIYGPIMEDKYSQSFFGNYHATYKGALESKDVLRTLSEYDVLLLPSYYPGEGYPGIIIEAYSLGLPVIATTWQAIPEMVEHLKSGVLIEPKSVTSLQEAILNIDEDNYSKLSQGAMDKFKEYNSSEVYRDVLEKMYCC